MVKFVATYERPEDVEAFEKGYFEEHLPLVRQFPDLQRLEVSRVTWPKADAPFYLMAELWYETRDEMIASLKSEVSGKAAAVLGGLVDQEKVTMYHLDVEEG